MNGRTERCDDIVLAGHKLLLELVRFGKMPLFERGNGQQAIVDGDSGLLTLTCSYGHIISIN